MGGGGSKPKGNKKHGTSIQRAVCYGEKWTGFQCALECVIQSRPMLFCEGFCAHERNGGVHASLSLKGRCLMHITSHHIALHEGWCFEREHRACEDTPAVFCNARERSSLVGLLPQTKEANPNNTHLLSVRYYF